MQKTCCSFRLSSFPALAGITLHTKLVVLRVVLFRVHFRLTFGSAFPVNVSLEGPRSSNHRHSRAMDQESFLVHCSEGSFSMCLCVCVRASSPGVFFLEFNVGRIMNSRLLQQIDLHQYCLQGCGKPARMQTADRGEYADHGSELTSAFWRKGWPSAWSPHDLPPTTLLFLYVFISLYPEVVLSGNAEDRDRRQAESF